MCSEQINWDQVKGNVLFWVQQSDPSTLNPPQDKPAHTLVVTNDEQGHWKPGVVTDTLDPNHDNIRISVLWGTIMSGAFRILLRFTSSFGY